MWIAFFSSVLLALCMAPSFALAEDIDTDPVPSELQKEVERTAAEYKDANAKAKEANKALKENRAKLDELEKSIPEQQAKSDYSARKLYKLEQQGSGIVEMLLTSEDFGDFIHSLEYASRVSEANMSEIDKLSKMKAELEETQSALKQSKIDADEHAAKAKEALDAAKEARREAQRRAREEAERKAKEAAEQAAKIAATTQLSQSLKTSNPSVSKEDLAKLEDEVVVDAKPDSNSKKDDSKNSGDTEEWLDDAKEGNSGESASAEGEGETSASEPVEFSTLTDDGIDWAVDQETFVEQWKDRLDAYLEGSPLAGQGATFAEAAWTYGVDPRWSPAISLTESSKGAACFKPHNAWGWGSESWDSWKEAIDAHVRGLARGYGYTITVGAAQKYCPPNWVFWYNNTVNEMNLI